MTPMSDPDPTATDGATMPPTPSPGERRLAHPPSDRYRAADEDADRAVPDPGASVARGVAIAAVVAIVGGVAIVLLGGVVAISAGLVVIAGAMGWGVGAALRFGAGDQIARRRRVLIAALLALSAIALAQLGLWRYALSEGGVLPLVDYLVEVYGPLVPLEAAAAAALAWLAAR
jgi:hypothetical protein